MRVVKLFDTDPRWVSELIAAGPLADYSPDESAKKMILPFML